MLIDIPNYVCHIEQEIDSSGQFWNTVTKCFNDGSTEITVTKGIKLTYTKEGE